MSSDVTYQGRPLGKIKLAENGTHKWVFVAESLEALTVLLGIEAADKIVVEKKPILYSEFQTQYLSHISVFYPAVDEWLLKNVEGRTLK